MPMNTPQDVTDRGVIVFKSIEDDLEGLRAKFDRLKEVWDKANELLMASTGVNRTRLLKAMTDEAAGKVAEALRIVAELHIMGTAIAEDSGTDILQPAGGPGR